jgi:acyl-CoA dehydrogenase
MQATIVRDGDEYVVNGRKWWSSGAMDPRCKVAIVMGVTDPEAHRYAQHSMILVPFDAPGVRIVRDLSVFGYHDQHGHPEVIYEDVRVPKENLIAQEGAGFLIAQARLGPGRIHHCMRAIGMSERALGLMSDRVRHRVAFHRPLADQGVIREWIAESRIEIEQARLLVLKAAWMMDTVGNKHAQKEIAAIKVVAARLACRVLDRAIQAFGGAGVSGDFPLAQMYAGARTLRLADGPDEVHLRAVARLELGEREGHGAPQPAAWE